MLSLATTVVLTSAIAGFAAAQNSSGLNINAIPLSTRSSWCLSELNECPMLCDMDAEQNACDANTLTYTCECSNGSAPDVAFYQGTLPFFICQETIAQCITNNPNDETAQSNCRTANQCGTGNISDVSETPSSSSAAPSSTMAGKTASMASATASSTGKASTKSSGAMAMARDYSMPILGGVAMVVFGLLA